MTSSDPNEPEVRLRREPPPFRRVEVRSVRPVTPRLTRLTLGGQALEGFRVELPAASIRLLIPSVGSEEFVIPTWNGNEFLYGDGSRPTIRTFTPRHVDPERLELVLDVVMHDGGAVSGWTGRATEGSPAAVSGPGRGYVIDEGAPGFLLAGDETAIPAICQLLEALPPSIPVTILVEVADPTAVFDFPQRAGVSIKWLGLPPGRAPGDLLVDAVANVDLVSGARVWVAGEAAAMHRIRKHCFESRRLPRTDVTVRGYWKAGRQL